MNNNELAKAIEAAIRFTRGVYYMNDTKDKALEVGLYDKEGNVPTRLMNILFETSIDDLLANQPMAVDDKTHCDYPLKDAKPCDCECEGLINRLMRWSDKLTNERNELQSELDRANAERDKCEGIVPKLHNCAYCHEEFLTADEARSHVNSDCEKHPMRTQITKLKSELDRTNEEIERLKK